MRGRDPDGLILGILGMGRIGFEVARRAEPHGLKLQYHNREPVSSNNNATSAEYVSFETLISTSDIISLHVPLNESTKDLIGVEAFSMMKEKVVIVNTARGAIIHEQAFREAIESGKVFAAGLDVYENEPEIPEWLRERKNVVLSPHIGAATKETQVCVLLKIYCHC